MDSHQFGGNQHRKKSFSRNTISSAISEPFVLCPYAMNLAFGLTFDTSERGREREGEGEREREREREREKERERERKRTSKRK